MACGRITPLGHMWNREIGIIYEMHCLHMILNHWAWMENDSCISHCRWALCFNVFHPMAHSSCRDDTYLWSCVSEERKWKVDDARTQVQCDVVRCGVLFRNNIAIAIASDQIRRKNTIFCFRLISFHFFLSFFISLYSTESQNHLKKKKQMMKEIMKKK